jgi:Ca-activated chloride channel homolog
VATRLEISWNGPANPDDTITVARSEQPPGASINRTSVREGNPLKLWMPSDPGEYEVRYILGRGAKVLALSSLTITAVTAQVEVAGPVKAAAWIEVKWEGPARDGDYISVANLKQQPGANVGHTPVKAGNPLKVRAPSDPGEYEVRYILARGAKLLAKAPITINPVTAEVTAPAAAPAGAEFEVRWQGPGYPEDFVSLARANQPPGGNVNKMTVLKGSPVKLRAPKEPGTYEVRYVLGRGNRLLAKTAITITAPDEKSAPR